MAGGIPPCSVKRFWIECDQEQAIKKANTINESIYKDGLKKEAYGFAKAVCTANRKWGVRVLQADFSEGSKFQRIENEFNGKAIDLKPSAQNDVKDLLHNVKALIGTLESHPQNVIVPDDLKRRLNKIVVYLMLCPKWPYEQEKNSIDQIQIVFRRFRDCWKLKNLTPPNQAKFKQFLSQLSKHLHLQSLALEEISTKIVKCAEGRAPLGSSSFEKLQGLIKRGMDRILWPDPSTWQSIVEFCQVFTRYAYIYKPDADNVEARAKLQEAVNRLVALLETFDRVKLGSTLLEFLKDLVRAIDGHYQLFQNRNLENLAPLVWALEALVKNEQCSQYLRTSGHLKALKDKKVFENFSTLFDREHTWRAVCQFVAELGNFELFDMVVLKRIDPKRPIAEDRLNAIFGHLNRRFKEEKDLSIRAEYEKMLLGFLEKLADANQLHFLKPYAKFPAHAANLRENLVKLGFKFMEDVDLELFFGNAAFRGLEFQKMDRADKVRRALLRLFMKFGPNPIVSKEEFEKALAECLVDFSTEYEHLSDEVLSQIGRSTPPGVDKTEARGLIPVEGWLGQSVMPIYRALKLLVLKCLPLEWNEATFNGEVNLQDRICEQDGEFYLIQAKGEDFALTPLKSVVGAAPMEEVGKPVKVRHSSTYGDVRSHLKGQLEDGQNRQAISQLTEVYMSASRHRAVKEAMEGLLKVLFARMREDSKTRFYERLTTLASFLNDVSPFFNNLGQLVGERFFNKTKLKTKISLNLREMKKGVDLTSPVLATLKEGDEIEVAGDAKEALMNDLTNLVSLLCNEDILNILKDCTLSELVKAISQFEGVVCRKVDELSYTVEDFRESFCQHHPTIPNLREIIGDLPVRKQIMDDYGAFLRSRTIPINFILPNQAIAIRLCQCEALKDRNLLMKLGTGQGKSIVIGLAALHEAKQVKDNPKGKVLVFTSYDHLARRDHALGQNFFQKDKISSVCISSLADVEQYGDSVKIVYADIEEIETIIRDIMKNLLNNKATPAQKNFIKMIFGQPGEDIRIILDEYDLLLHDLEFKEPYVTEIPTTMLDTDFVRNNPAYCPWLKNNLNVDPNPVRRNADSSTGKEYRTVSWYDPRIGFHLAVSVLRLSKLISRSKRVIGLSGTALQGEEHSLKDPLFFEIPSSQNPNAFGTVIQEGDAKPDTEYPYISRQLIKELEQPTLDPTGSFYLVSKAAVDEYCRLIIGDIKDIQQAHERNGIEYKRPVLIFGNLFFNYKTHGAVMEPRSLWDTLRDALRADGIAFEEVKSDVTDAELQRIARSGKVALSTIKYGRGADIRVSLDITEGLHVLIGTPVRHKRLLQQLIGRTGRMGRSGSYSIVTLGSYLMPPPDRAELNSEYFGALHDLTRFFVNKLIAQGNCSAEDRKNWLMFLTNVFSERSGSRKIKESHAKALCGRHYEENVIPKKFLN